MVRSTNDLFRRKTLLLSGAAPVAKAGIEEKVALPAKVTPNLPLDPGSQLSNVLVVNASHDMAKEITLQLTLRVPDCSIMYAPSIEVAKWILGRRAIDLVVASPLLPDGSVTRLRPVLESMEAPPILIVVGNSEVERIHFPNESEYRCTKLKRINTEANSGAAPIIHRQRAQTYLQTSIKSLGADIRNDLNNPLQEIVAMVFVAKTGSEISSGSTCALDAIERAALNMSKVVNALEDKIRGAIG